jgi:hypothetical protein
VRLEEGTPGGPRDAWICCCHVHDNSALDSQRNYCNGKVGAL